MNYRLKKPLPLQKLIEIYCTVSSMYCINNLSDLVFVEESMLCIRKNVRYANDLILFSGTIIIDDSVSNEQNNFIYRHDLESR